MKQNVALVLSSGGARGVAHIGVIEELENQGYKIKSIAGTSMGALVGGIYATGKLPEYKEWLSSLSKLDVFKMIDFTFSTSGLVKGNRIFNEMRKLVPDTNIEDLKISFAAVATDIINKKEIVFTEGNLFEAIRASISIPTVFTPMRKDGLHLVDGGILNPIPINRVKRSDNDILVVVNVNAHIPKSEIKIPESKAQRNGFLYNEKIKYFKNKLAEITPKSKKEKLGYFNLITETISLMLYQISQLTLEKHQPDILINVSKQSCGNYDFYKADELIEVGKKAAIISLKKYKTKTIKNN